MKTEAEIKNRILELEKQEIEYRRRMFNEDLFSLSWFMNRDCMNVTKGEIDSLNWILKK